MAEEKKEKKPKKGWSLKIKKRCLTIYWQNFMLTASVVMLTLALLGSAFFALTYSYAVDERSEQMQSKATIVSHMVSSYIESGSLTGLRELANFASNVTDAQFLICNTDGDLLLTTDPTLANRVLTMPQEVIDGAMSGDAYTTRTTLGGIYEETHFVVGVPIESNGALVGFVLAVTGARALTTMWRTFIGLFFMTAVTVLLLSFVVSAWVSMRQSRPIHEMAEATRRFADGNFDVRMHNYEGVTEISELTEAFNSMADSLQETERQRREFIANVSHELKTPMTTIAGYTDGILDGTIPPEQEKEYLRIISDEARRLSRLVRRMLEVSQLQSRDLTRTKAPFDVCESMRRVLISMEKKITDRGLDVDADIPDGSIMVLGDNDLITQVIYNLLENATKFARAGSALYLGVTTLNGKALVSVRNEGDTIPAEEIPLLFERFHKSDKSRSEDKDGVGLGLYVVKTILEQHKEHIAVTSENGLTTFTFTITLAGGLTPQ
jgi:signal transduction histidine kinase